MDYLLSTMKKAYIQLHASLVLAGFTGIFGRLISLNEGLISWYRLLLSGLVLLLFYTLTGKKHNVTLKNKMSLAVSGTILGLHWLFFYGSIKYANISVGVICFALTSFFNAVLSPLIDKKKLSLQELLLSGITVCGIGFIFGLDAGYRTGIILGIISSVFGALYTIYNEKQANKHESSTIVLYQMLGGFVGISFIMPVFLYISPVETLLPSLEDFGWLMVLSVLCTVVMYSLITASLKHISSFTVSLSYNLEPIYTIILAILIYHEDKGLSAGFYIGLSLIVLSLVLQMYRMKKLQQQTVNG